MINTGPNIGIVELLFFCLPTLVWVILAVLAISSIRKDNLNETARALWVLIVLLVPLLGAVIYWWVKPGSANASRE